MTMWNAIYRAAFAEEEDIECIVFGRCENNPIPDEFIGIPLSVEAAKPFLSREWNSGYGCADDCLPTFAYTKSWIIFFVEYDRSTHEAVLPRNPIKGQESWLVN